MIKKFIDISKSQFLFIKFYILKFPLVFKVFYIFFSLGLILENIKICAINNLFDLKMFHFLFKVYLVFAYSCLFVLFLDLISLTPEHFFMIIKNFIKGNELSVHQVIDNVDYSQMLKKTNLDQLDQKLFENNNLKLEQLFEKENLNLKKIICEKNYENIIEEELRAETIVKYVALTTFFVFFGINLYNR